MKEAVARERLSRMLEQDKEDVNIETRAAALRDFSRVAGEYFEYDKTPEFTVKRAKGGYEVCLSFRANRVKNFTVLK